MMNKRLVFIILILMAFSANLCLAQTKIANDPTRIGVGARILGMGKAYLGTSDDLLGIFINPAALSEVENWQATSMQGKFVNEYNYLNLGTATPFPFGSFGLGYVGSSISFTSPVPTTEVLDGVRIIPSTTEGVAYDFIDSVLLFSWGKDLTGFLGTNFFNDVSAGATLKVFILDLSGPNISQGKASGNELDVGITYKPATFLKTGLVVQNALPHSMGGKIRWQSGIEEVLPSVLKIGTSLKVLGEQGLRKYGRHDLSISLDGDFAPNRPEIPNLWHLGVEWLPVELIALRAGIDQDYVGPSSGTNLVPANNFTAGVGVIFNGFRFDYAYHQYNNVTDNDTHYFSITYGIEKKKPEERRPSFSLTPPDKTVVYTPDVTLQGKVLDPEIEKVAVNDKTVKLKDDSFVADLKLELRKNEIIVRGFKGEILLDTERVRLLKIKKFSDFKPDYWANLPISILAEEGVVAGYPDGSFRPENEVTRAEMCKLLMVTKGVQRKILDSKPFSDVKADHWAANYINKAVAEGIVTAFPDGSFHPKGLVSRAEGVVMISRLSKLPSSKSLDIPFPDLSGRHWATKNIIKAKEAGILQYLEGKLFRPERNLKRAEAAEMLTKSPLMSARVNDILDWEKGY